MLWMAVLLAAESPPAKLFVITNNGIAVTEFRSLEACRRAADDLKLQVRANADATAPKGFRIVEYAPIATYCVAG